jgi:hypothetical protein
MKHQHKAIGALIWMIALCLGTQPSIAQEQNENPPKPAAQHSPLFAPTDIEQDAGGGTDLVQADNRPLSGVQNPTVGRPENRHSYWVPGIQYGNTTRSNSLAGANSGWNTTNFISTNLSLLESWSHSTLSANYTGGGYFSSDPAQGHGEFQQLAANYELDGKRWQVFLIDQFAYLPQSSFGFGGGSGLATPGVSGALAVPVANLQSSYLPGQTNFAVLGPEYSNSSSAQFTYKASARGSVTVAAVYGILRFVNPGNINSDMETGVFGYDYAVTRKDAVGVSYHFGAYRYPGEPQALADQVINIEYGRKITGRMGLKLSAGPEITSFRIPIANLRRTTSGSGSASLTYAFGPGTSLEAHYMHGVSSGSGVFTGAISDQLSATFFKQLTRVWNGNLNFGYGRNGQIVAVAGSSAFDSWFGGAGLSRSIGHMTYLSCGYQAQIQTGNVVPGSSNNTVHQIYISLQWHSRPFVLR